MEGKVERSCKEKASSSGKKQTAQRAMGERIFVVGQNFSTKVVKNQKMKGRG